MLTPQQIFDTVGKHLHTQGCASTSRPEDKTVGPAICMYKNPVGKKCAVGCLIKAEHYNPIYEGVGLSQLLVQDGYAGKEKTDALRNSLVASGIDTHDRETMTLLQELQYIHDGLGDCTIDPTEFRSTAAKQMEEIARRYKLKLQYLAPENANV